MTSNTGNVSEVTHHESLRSSRSTIPADPRGEATKAGLTAQQVEDVLKIDREGLELFTQSLERKKQHRK